MHVNNVIIAVEKIFAIREVCKEIRDLNIISRLGEKNHLSCIIELQLESVKTKSDFINTLVKIGSSLGYSFTVADVEESIQSFTNQTYTDHICLSIGCWKLS